MSNNSNTNVDPQQELQSLRQLRASLTGLDVLTKQILQDLEIMTRNYESINAIFDGWKVTKKREREPLDATRDSDGK
ncbi:15347_t:CDS:2 [Cetraspora pellucida]|uniref:15347_t:CDS:1 n=1 Tax=Cetraspora pellucida TaxID=1433469 RepID=A0ACA9NVR8_9GLOM|nr:15347_t:CDS:2 [Cetraspora pellucida]